MSGPDAALLALAARHGIDPTWHDYRGEHRHVGLDTIRALLRAVGVDPTSPEDALRATEARRGALPALLTGIAGGSLAVPLGDGEAALRVAWQLTDALGTTHHGVAEPYRTEDGASAIALTLPAAIGHARLAFAGHDAAVLIAPPACHRGGLRHGRLWGLGAQLYGLRGASDGGLGHLGLLPPLVRAAAAAGADALAVSPLHALFAADPGAYSPYSPSHRAMLNGWMADPGGLPEVADEEALAASLGLGGLHDAGLHDDGPLIDYPVAVPKRLAMLRALFSRFRETHAGGELGAAFAQFRAAGGATLENHARFEVLHAHHFGSDSSKWDWRGWAAPYRTPFSPEVARFAAEHADDVSFHVFLQWLAARQIDAAQAAAREAGMSIGLIADLAVGNSPGGSRAWSGTAALLPGVSIGAPPDVLNTVGQDWGLTTFAPGPLAAAGFAPFIEDLRAAMAHAGGIRLDHVMGLSRIWCIPEGASPQEGAYLRFPMADMLRVVAAESHAAQAIVIGEDLGTVPEGYGETLAAHGLYGIRVMFFEREGGGFAPPARYDAHATATSTTHDVPTLAGWWEGADIPLRAGLGLLAPGESPAEAAEHRAAERAALWNALVAHGGAQGEAPARGAYQLGTAVARFLGETPSPLVLLPLEDVTMTPDQPNLPGTVAQHPNWRRRVPRPAERMLDEEPAVSILANLDAARRTRR